MAAILVCLLATASTAGPPEVVTVPRLVAVKDLRPGDYFCAEVGDEVWLCTCPAGNPDDWPTSNYYGVEQLPIRLDAVYAVSLTSGKLYLWKPSLRVRPVIDARLVVRVHGP